MTADHYDHLDELRLEHPMQTLTLEEAQTHLAEIIENLPPGEEVVLTKNDQPVATIRATAATVREAPRFGTLKGTILYIAPDFDYIPEGFEDYLP
jgi:antitoxin (DNA-binding transcriptional repressor) of toxin-antitoxin stability system